MSKTLNVNGRTYLDQTDINTADGIFTISGANKVDINSNMDIDATVDIDGRLDVDNIRLDANTISTINANGTLSITPHGTGQVYIPKVLNVNGRTYLDQTDINTDDGIFKISGANKVDIDSNMDIDANMDIDGTVDIDGITYLDNLKFDGNTISANNTDGDVILTPNGTGWVKTNKLDINGTLDVDGTTYLDNMKFDVNTISANNTDGDIVLTPNGTGWVKTSKLDINGILDVDGASYLDNMKFDVNTISTTNTNGSLTLNPHGTGYVYIPKVLNVNGRTHLDQTDIVTTDGIFKISGTNKVDIQSDVTMSKTLDVNGRTYLDRTDINTADGSFKISGAYGVDIDANMDIDGTVDIYGRLDVDNIRLDANTISTTNKNGHLYLTPTGTGQVYIDKVLNVNGRTYLDQTDISTADGIFKISGAKNIDIDVHTMDIDANMDIDGTVDIDGITYLDNMKFDGTTISTTNTNGHLYLTPNGTGQVYINKVLNVNGRTYLDQTDISTDDGYFKVSGTNKMVIQSNVEMSKALNVSGRTYLDTIKFEGNAITTTNTNGTLSITPHGTGEVYIPKVLNVNGRTHLDQTDIVTTDGIFKISGANKVDIQSDVTMSKTLKVTGSTTLATAYATTPASSSNDTRVATTSWVRSHTSPHTDGKTVYVNMYTILGWNTTKDKAFTAARNSIALVKGDLLIVRHQYRTSHRGNGGTSYQYHSTYTMYIMTSATGYSANFGV